MTTTTTSSNEGLIIGPDDDDEKIANEQQQHNGTETKNVPTTTAAAAGANSGKNETQNGSPLIEVAEPNNRDPNGNNVDPTAATTTVAIITPTTSTCVTTTSKSTPIDLQLADSADRQARRHWEMFSTRTNSNNDSSSSQNPVTVTLNRVYRQVRTDKNSARLALITVALVSSFFASILLAIASADPPYQHGSLYRYSDLMRLLSKVHDKSIEITPNLSKHDWEKEKILKMSNNNSESESEFSSEQQLMKPQSPFSRQLNRLIQQWWPIRHVEFESDDVILSDGGYFSNNYHTFQTAFNLLLVFSDFLLLFGWLYYLAAKEFAAHKQPVSDKLYHDATKTGQPSSSSPESSSSNNIKRFTERIIRLVKGKDLRKLKRSWFDEAPKRPWEQTIVIIIATIVAIHLLLFVLLLNRPNMFTLVLHQITYVCLSVCYLGSTKIEGPLKTVESTLKRRSTDSIPRSLRGTGTGTGTGSSRINFRSSSLVSVPESGDDTNVRMQTGGGGGDIESNNKVFTIEEKISKNEKKLKHQQSSSTYPSESNPFDDDDEKEIMMKRTTTNRYVDEEAEREVEKV